MILFVSFMKPVTFKSTGVEYWSATERSHEGITCADKGNHILFSYEVGGKRKRSKVPLTNIAQTIEEDDEPTKKGKEP